MEETGKSKTGEAGRKVRIARAYARASQLAPIVAELRRSGITSWYGIAMELNRRGLPGQRHDITSFDALIAGIYCLALIGDKGFDAGWLRERLRANDMEAVVLTSGGAS